MEIWVFIRNWMLNGYHLVFSVVVFFPFGCCVCLLFMASDDELHSPSAPANYRTLAQITTIIRKGYDKKKKKKLLHVRKITFKDMLPESQAT